MSKELNKGDAANISYFVEQRAWAVMREKLEDKMTTMGSLTTIPLDIPREDIAREVEARSLAIKTIRMWLNEVETLVDNHKQVLDNGEEEQIYKVR